MATTPHEVSAQTPNHPIDDPLRVYEPFLFRKTLYPLGFPVEIETNNPELLSIATLTWPLHRQSELVPPLKLRLGVTDSPGRDCPPAPVARALHQLLSIVSDANNFIVCDLREGFAYGWFTSAAILHPSFLRHCMLEGAIMSLLTAQHISPVHAACVSFAGRGLLLSGDSGAGKSTLAYACARQGWLYTSDDSCYFLWGSDDLRVRGNCEQFRFRPTARELFPELRDRAITPRIVGKPSIEVPSASLPGIVTAEDTAVHAFISLQRHDSPGVSLEPLPASAVAAALEQSLMPMPEIRALQRPAIERAHRLPAYTLRYRDLDPAIDRLRELALGLDRAGNR